MKSKFTTTALMLTALMFVVSCGNKTTENHQETTTETADTTSSAMPGSAPEAQSALTVYQCPMKCEGEKTYAVPGSCPVCNMDLEKLENVQEHKHDSMHSGH